MQIISVAMLLDNVPSLVLTLLYTTDDPNPRYLAQSVLGALFLGTKIGKLLEIRDLIQQREVLKFKIFHDRLFPPSDPAEESAFQSLKKKVVQAPQTDGTSEVIQMEELHHSTVDSSDVAL